MFVKFFFRDTNCTDFESEAEENMKILVQRVKDIFEPGNLVMLTDVGVTRDMFTGQLLLLRVLNFNTGQWITWQKNARTTVFQDSLTQLFTIQKLERECACFSATERTNCKWKK